MAFTAQPGAGPTGGLIKHEMQAGGSFSPQPRRKAPGGIPVLLRTHPALV
jgi:hypothetical protein